MMKKEFPILYKYTTKGAIQQWQIVVDGDKFYTIEGIKDGKLTTSKPTICIGKNIGKKNETTPEQQALAEATSKHKGKLDKSYNEVLTEKKNYFEPMLAETYGEVSVSKPKRRVGVEWGKYRVFVQPKLDGLRSDSQNNTLTSRNGKPFTSCPHLYQNTTQLDGELYTHSYNDDFNKIVSLIRSGKDLTDEQKEEAKVMEFWAYDYPSVKGVFSVRYEALKKWFSTQNNSSIKLVPTYEVHSHKEVLEYHKKFLKEGYEGTIIRTDTAEYQNKRCDQLLKHKDFIDEEFEIFDYVEGKGSRAGTIGKFWVILDKSKPYDKKKRINCCKSNVKGVHSFLKEVWDNRDTYIGTEATIQFFGYTPAGKLRFPYITKLNRKEYE